MRGATRLQFCKGAGEKEGQYSNLNMHRAACKWEQQCIVFVRSLIRLLAIEMPHSECRLLHKEGVHVNVVIVRHEENCSDGVCLWPRPFPLSLWQTCL